MSEEKAVELGRLQEEAKLLDTCDWHGMLLREGYSDQGPVHDMDGSDCREPSAIDKSVDVTAPMSYQACAVKAQQLLLEAEKSRNRVLDLNPDRTVMAEMAIANGATAMAAVWAALAAVADDERLG